MKRTSYHWVGFGLSVAAAFLLLVGLYLAISPQQSRELLAADKTPSKVEPQKLFVGWPEGKPEVVLLLSGQTYGYLQKCGCSNPQKGGLERRYNLVEKLRKEKGWSVIGLDIGDTLRRLRFTPDDKQTLAKYARVMEAMKLMDYRAVAVGEEEYRMGLLKVIGEYALQPKNEYPRMLIANLENPSDFVDIPRKGEIVKVNNTTLGIVGLTGGPVFNKFVGNNNFDQSAKFNPEAIKVLNGVFDEWAKAKQNTDLNILLYQGPFELRDETTGQIKKNPDGSPVRPAVAAAEAIKKFQIVVCLSDYDSAPPAQPYYANDKQTMIIRTGVRGQSVGLVGVFKTDKGYSLHYQLVDITEEFDTPPDQEKDHPILQMLQSYADQVERNDYLSKIPKKKSEQQVTFKGATYVGDSECVVCHKAEHDLWAKSKHAEAYKALEVIATKPTKRNFDGECIVCHTVGYEYESGYVNAKQTPHLKNVQCESCHGPASLHVAEEKANIGKPAAQQSHRYVASQKPYGNGKLPSLATFEKMAAEHPANRDKWLTPAEKTTYLAVKQMCMKCHDSDNDPKFELETYWKTVNHSNLKMGK